MQHSIFRTVSSLLLAAALAELPMGCANLTSQETTTVTTTEQDIATGAKIASGVATALGFTAAANDLWAVYTVAQAYGTQTVPTNILAATVQLPGIASTVLPLVTGKANGPKTQAIIAGAAQLVTAASAALASPTPAS